MKSKKNSFLIYSKKIAKVFSRDWPSLFTCNKIKINTEIKLSGNFYIKNLETNVMITIKIIVKFCTRIDFILPTFYLRFFDKLFPLLSLFLSFFKRYKFLFSRFFIFNWFTVFFLKFRLYNCNIIGGLRA